MIKIIKFQGGLGNQMFQYAMYLALRKKNPFSFFLFDINGSLGCHNGYELTKIFPAISFNRVRWYERFQHRLPFVFKRIITIKQPQSLTFYRELLKPVMGRCIYDGFWQSEKYFDSVAREVRKSFTFNIDLLNDNTTYIYKQLIEEKHSVSVHIRRGDYLNEPFRLTCTSDYYEKAISHILKNVENPHFYFFSDDMEWVKDHYSNLTATFINWNLGKESWQDMFLMSQCKHNIIANSSFSWWGAWLNKNGSKIVIAPSLWFKDDSKQDIQPSSWILI